MIAPSGVPIILIIIILKLWQFFEFFGTLSELFYIIKNELGEKKDFINLYTHVLLWWRMSCYRRSLVSCHNCLRLAPGLQGTDTNISLQCCPLLQTPSSHYLGLQFHHRWYSSNPARGDERIWSPDKSLFGESIWSKYIWHNFTTNERTIPHYLWP